MRGAVSGSGGATWAPLQDGAAPECTGSPCTPHFGPHELSFCPVVPPVRSKSFQKDICKFQELFSSCPRKTYTRPLLLCACLSHQPAGGAWEPGFPCPPPRPPSLLSGPVPTLAALARALPGLSGRPSSAWGARCCWDTPTRTGCSVGWPSAILFERPCCF